MTPRSYKYRLYPNRRQQADLAVMLGAFCDLYNAALQQRIEAYRRRGVSLNYFDQANELKAVRAADEPLLGYSYSAEQQVLRRLNKAFTAFFRRVKAGGKAGFPRFQAKSRFDSAEFRVGDGLTIRKSKRLRIVGINGEIKVKWHRSLPAGAKASAAVLHRNAGKWFITFQIALPDEKVPLSRNPAIGIDVGLSSLVALSNGQTVAAPRWARKAAKKQRRLQRALARAKRSSKRRGKSRQILARHSAYVANQRRDFLHKLSRSLVNDYGLIAIEDLTIKRMARRSMFARSIHDAAWGQLRQFIEYKAESAGVRVIAVDPRGTSQICSGCGSVPDTPKILRDRRHECANCGLVLDRDVNAAQNILHRALGPGTGLRTLSVRVAA